MAVPMAEPKIIFKHPPLSQALVGISFLNNLEVADDRARFHTTIRSEFPLVVMPERNTLTYDFGDYSLQTEDGAIKLEIGMGYFRLVSTKYSGFGDFKRMFLSALGLFSKCYDLKNVLTMVMSYNNVLPLESNQKFSDIFVMDMRLPQELQSELSAGQGVMMFQKPEGFLSVQLQPQLVAMEVKTYGFNLVFGSLPSRSFDVAANSFGQLLDVAHGYIESFFFGLLTRSYLEYMRAR
jgi:uncharacterized protein (TIGR04255 family)